MCEAAEDNASVIEDMQTLVEKLKAMGMETTSAEARLEAVRHMRDSTLTDSKERYCCINYRIAHYKG